MNTLNEHQHRPHGIVHIEGAFTTREQADIAVDAYKREWPREGYGTELVVTPAQDGFVVAGFRWGSAE